MDGWINVGAYVDGVRPPSKKALRDALAYQPDRVIFDQTSILSSLKDQPQLTLNDIPAGAKLSVVGPDPYVKRTWYATVEVRSGIVHVE